MPSTTYAIRLDEIEVQRIVGERARELVITPAMFHRAADFADLSAADRLDVLEPCDELGRANRGCVPSGRVWPDETTPRFRVARPIADALMLQIVTLITRRNGERAIRFAVVSGPGAGE